MKNEEPIKKDDQNLQKDVHQDDQNQKGDHDPEAGASYTGELFHVWDESPRAARRWAEKLAEAEAGAGTPDPQEEPPLRILVPIDFSASSRAAARHAERLAQRDEGEIHLLHVLPAPRDIEDPRRAFRLVKRQRETGERLGEMADGLDAPTRTHLFAGETTAVIREAARGLDADLVVMGAHGAPRPGRVGSVARCVQEDPPCPVHLIGPPPA